MPLPGISTEDGGSFPRLSTATGIPDQHTLARRIADWIWRKERIDQDESWRCMMPEEATEEIRKIITSAFDESLAILRRELES